MSTQLGRVFTFVFVATALVCCGKKGPSADVKVAVNPGSPIVFTSPVTLPSGQQIAKNWFSFEVALDNQTTGSVNDDYSSVTVVGLHVEVTGQDVNGNMFNTTKDFSPSQFTIVNGNTTCNYSDFGQFDRGGAPLAVLTNSSNPFPTKGVNTNLFFGFPDNKSACAILTPIFIVDGLPDSPNGNTSFNYSVKVQPIGWFGDRNTQKQRFQNSIQISTQ